MSVNICSNFIIVFSLITSLASVGAFTDLYSSTNAIAETSFVSVEQYDKMKNCTTDLSKKASSIEYLTYFNCGHVSNTNNDQTVREFSLIVDEKQKIPISYEGHVHEGWTFNGTIPGPTIRVTEGDLVRTAQEINTLIHSIRTLSTQHKLTVFLWAGILEVQ